jgi:hypothetical protein
MALEEEPALEPATEARSGAGSENWVPSLEGCSLEGPPLEEPVSFERVVDAALERVWDKKVQFSIKRLREMEAQLLIMEKELEGILHAKGGRRAGGV